MTKDTMIGVGLAKSASQLHAASMIVQPMFRKKHSGGWCRRQASIDDEALAADQAVMDATGDNGLEDQAEYIAVAELAMPVL